ncbi:hypothetical protein EGT50_15830, partial [Rhodococcus xishaensis]
MTTDMDSFGPVVNIMPFCGSVPVGDGEAELRGLSIGPTGELSVTFNFDYSLNRGAQVQVDGDVSLFGPADIELLARTILAVLSGVVADPGVRVGEVEILDDRERRRVLEVWNDTAVAVAEATIVE